MPFSYILKKVGEMFHLSLNVEQMSEPDCEPRADYKNRSLNLQSLQPMSPTQYLQPPPA